MSLYNFVEEKYRNAIRDTFILNGLDLLVQSKIIERVGADMKGKRTISLNRTIDSTKWGKLCEKIDLTKDDVTCTILQGKLEECVHIISVLLIFK